MNSIKTPPCDMRYQGPLTPCQAGAKSWKYTQEEYKPEDTMTAMEVEYGIPADF